MTAVLDTTDDEKTAPRPSLAVVAGDGPKPGRKPGSPKVPSSGRRKGTPNVASTAAKESAREVLEKNAGRLSQRTVHIALGHQIRVRDSAGPNPVHIYPSEVSQMKALELCMRKLVPDLSASEVDQTHRFISDYDVNDPKTHFERLKALARSPEDQAAIDGWASDMSLLAGPIDKANGHDSDGEASIGASPSSADDGGAPALPSAPAPAPVPKPGDRWRLYGTFVAEAVEVLRDGRPRLSLRDNYDVEIGRHVGLPSAQEQCQRLVGDGRYRAVEGAPEIEEIAPARTAAPTGQSEERPGFFSGVKRRPEVVLGRANSKGRRR